MSDGGAALRRRRLSRRQPRQCRLQLGVTGHEAVGGEVAVAAVESITDATSTLSQRNRKPHFRGATQDCAERESLLLLPVVD